MSKKEVDPISEKLDHLIALIKIAFADRIAKRKDVSLKRSKIKKQIYEACKKKPQNRQELAHLLGKSPDYVSSYLTLMTREGLLVTKEKDNETYYVAFV